ncbi:hypothetical protein EOM39_06350 [Candidatus Gracilibacteria bacterium]|nr:hypothetical protein [Candidatus Gracilibacteria bacterium]
MTLVKTKLFGDLDEKGIKKFLHLSTCDFPQEKRMTFETEQIIDLIKNRLMRIFYIEQEGNVIFQMVSEPILGSGLDGKVVLGNLRGIKNGSSYLGDITMKMHEFYNTIYLETPRIQTINVSLKNGYIQVTNQEEIQNTLYRFIDGKNSKIVSFDKQTSKFSRQYGFKGELPIQEKLLLKHK